MSKKLKLCICPKGLEIRRKKKQTQKKWQKADEHVRSQKKKKKILLCIKGEEILLDYFGSFFNVANACIKIKAEENLFPWIFAEN